MTIFFNKSLTEHLAEPTATEHSPLDVPFEEFHPRHESLATGTEAFAELMEDPDPSVRILAAAGIRKFGDSAEEEIFLNHETIEVLAQGLLDVNYGVRVECLKSLMVCADLVEEPIWSYFQNPERLTENTRALLKTLEQALPIVSHILHNEPGSDWVAVRAATKFLGMLPQFADQSVPLLLREIRLGRHVDDAFKSLLTLTDEFDFPSGLRKLMESGDIGLALSTAQRMLGIPEPEHRLSIFGGLHFNKQEDLVEGAGHAIPHLIRIAALPDGDAPLLRITLARDRNSFEGVDEAIANHKAAKGIAEDLAARGDPDDIVIVEGLPAQFRMSSDPRGEALSVIVSTLEHHVDRPKALAAFVDELRREPVISQLLECLDRSRPSPHRASAAQIVSYLGIADPRIIFAVSELLYGSLYEQIVAAETLHKLGDRNPNTVEKLIEYLRDGSKYDEDWIPDYALDNAPRIFALYGELALKHLPTLIDLLKEGNSDKRARAADFIGTLGPDASLAGEAIIETLKEHGGLERMSHIKALAAIHYEPEIAVPILVSLLRGSLPSRTPVPKGEKDAVSYSRDEATAALIAYGSDAKTAIPALEEALQSEDAEIRKAATHVLDRITAA